jgi:CheY-like chemotaxis protein
VVDDISSNRDVLVAMLKPMGFEIVEAINGQQAVELASKTQFDLILMDRRMPVMDGLQAISHINRMNKSKPVGVIAVSASVSERDQALSKEMGYDGFLPKPVSWKKLSALLEEHLNIEWLYEEDEDDDRYEENIEPIIKPAPAAEIEALLDLAMCGDIRGILNRAEHIDNMGKEYRPFARRLRNLAERFEEKKILTLVKAYIGKET